MDEQRIRTVVLAAGRSERMGFDKLAAPFAGVPLARRTALALAPLEPLIVTTAALAEAIGQVPGVRVVLTEPTAGPSVTLGLANASIPADVILAVVPADVPFLDAAACRALFVRVPDDVDLAWPLVGETPGHPALWSPRARSRIAALREDEPPARLRRAADLRTLAVPMHDEAYVVDVDTPQAWADAERRALRAPR